MASNRKLLGAAAFSLALAGGGVAGAVLGTPSLSGAQDDTTEETAPAAPEGGRFEHKGEMLAAAADAIGISEDDLRAALEDGQSIAQVAEAHDVDVQTVIDALVANGTDRLEEAIAELPDRMSDLVNREGFPEGPRGHGPGGRGHFGAHIEAAAEVLGISEDELRTALRDGETLADLAEANDVSVDSVVEALVADATARIDEAVADGRLDEDRAAEIKDTLTERVTDLVNGEGPGPGGGFRPDGPPPADAGDDG